MAVEFALWGKLQIFRTETFLSGDPCVYKAGKQHKFAIFGSCDDPRPGISFVQCCERKMDCDGENGLQDTAEERRLTFLYATQTGNAQDIAESLARHAIRQHFVTHCLSVEDYNPVDPRLKDQSYDRRISLMRLVWFSLLALQETENILTR